jgi:hypothetical protein
VTKISVADTLKQKVCDGSLNHVAIPDAGYGLSLIVNG